MQTLKAPEAGGEQERAGSRFTCRPRGREASKPVATRSQQTAAPGGGRGPHRQGPPQSNGVQRPPRAPSPNMGEAGTESIPKEGKRKLGGGSEPCGPSVLGDDTEAPSPPAAGGRAACAGGAGQEAVSAAEHRPGPSFQGSLCREASWVGDPRAATAIATKPFRAARRGAPGP